MTNFNLNIPTEIFFGKKSEEKIGQLLNRDNITKVLLVYGTSSIKSTGLYKKIIQLLLDSSIEVEEYSGIKSNPILSDVNNAAQIGKKVGVEAILAVGGGSVMDSAKAIASAIYNNCNAWDFYTGTEIKGALPLYNIVTLAATASEMNPSFVITNDKTKEKLGMGSPFCYPKVSILNPELTITVPPNYTAYSAIDIFAHIIEDYLTGVSVPNLVSRLKESLIRTVFETTELILQNPEDYNARAEFMWTATMALNGTTNRGTSGASFPNHMIVHGVSGVHDIPHGAGLSIIIPAWMKFYKDKNRSQFSRFAKEIFNTDSIDSAIDELEKWFHSLGSPIRFSEYNIDETTFDEITEKAFSHSKKWNLDNTYSRDVIKKILFIAK